METAQEVAQPRRGVRRSIIWMVLCVASLGLFFLGLGWLPSVAGAYLTDETVAIPTSKVVQLDVPADAGVYNVVASGVPKIAPEEFVAGVVITAADGTRVPWRPDSFPPDGAKLPEPDEVWVQIDLAEFRGKGPLTIDATAHASRIGDDAIRISPNELGPLLRLLLGGCCSNVVLLGFSLVALVMAVISFARR